MRQIEEQARRGGGHHCRPEEDERGASRRHWPAEREAPGARRRKGPASDGEAAILSSAPIPAADPKEGKRGAH